MKYERIVTDESIHRALEANHKLYSKKVVDDALDYIKAKYEGQMRKSGEPYQYHPMRVAKFLSDLGFDTNVVIAGLLHDIVEDCNTLLTEIRELYGPDIAGLVDCVTAVSKLDAGYNAVDKVTLDTMSDVMLFHAMSTHALYIMIADRIDNLRTIDVCGESKQFAKAEHTRDVLIPIVRRAGAHQLAQELEELCFRIQHRDRYELISECCHKMREQHRGAVHAVLDLFTQMCRVNTKGGQRDDVLQNGVSRFICTPRSASSIFRQIIRSCSNLEQELPHLLSEENFYFALYDLTIVLKDQFSSNPYAAPLEMLYRLYEQELYKEGIRIKGKGKSHSCNSVYLFLKDKEGNTYRLYVDTERSYRMYCLGYGADQDDALPLTVVDDISLRDTYRSKIKVFLRNGDARVIDDGATVLDLAFAIDAGVGMRFQYATIDRSKSQMPAYTRLYEGDTIIIGLADTVQVSSSWIRYVHTSKAKDALAIYYADR